MGARGQFFPPANVDIGGHCPLPPPSSQCPGVHRNTHSDMLYICVCKPDLTYLHKREVSSAEGKFFDIAGWFSPSTEQIKTLTAYLEGEAWMG